LAVELTGADVALESDDSFERLGQSLDGLSDEGHIDDEDGVPAAGERRVRISRTYLWLLGYLKKDNGKGDADSDYSVAVNRFQTDIGLAFGSTLADAGWEALRELAQYDTDTGVTRWLGNDSGRPALERAVHLRLFSYGLIKARPSHKVLTGHKLQKQNKALAAGLDDFRRITSRLRLGDTHFGPGFNVALLQLLFSHNSLIRRIQWKDDGYRVFSGHPDLPLQQTAASKLTKRFVGNLALVELWLLGYEVRPGNFKPDGAHSRERDGTLHAALDKFARDRKLPQANADQIKVAKWFFEEANAIGDADSGEAAVGDEDLDQILANKAKRTALEKSYKSLGARILDGVKRAVSWVVGIFRRVGRFVKQLARNVARVIHKGVAPIISHLRAMFRVSAIGFSYFFRSPVAGSSIDSVHIRKRADFDMEVFVNSGASQAKVDVFFKILDKLVRAMELGGRIIGSLWTLIRMAIKLSNAVIGWLSLILVAMKFGNWFKSVVGLARESYLLIGEIDQLEDEFG